MTAPLLVIAAGGTGGHMFPAQALAEAMVRRGWRVQLLTDERGARHAGGFPHSVEVAVTDAATTARGGLRGKLAAPFRILRGAMQARARFRADRPSVVIGFGGYPAVPAMLAAWVMRLPRMIHEQNGVLGRVNALFARRVDLVACGTWPTDLPAGVRHIHTGNPVRRAVMEKAEAQYIPPGDYPMSLLVIGGSQGARILSDVVPGAIALLPDAMLKHLRVSHQAREEDLDRVVRRYEDAGIVAEVQTFFRDVPARISEAQLVISRAGASSVADITVIGRPAIFIPLASAIRDEQTANARGVVEQGGALVIAEADLTALALAKLIHSVLSDESRASLMAAASLSHGKPDATDTLVELVADLAEGGGAIEELTRK